MTVKVFEGEVPTAFVEEVEERVGKMSKRCIRRGMPVPRLTLGKPYTKETKDDAGHAVVVEWTPVAIEADPLRINGWRLAAVVTPALKGGHAVPLLTPAPGETVTDVLTNDPYRCEHCGRVDGTRKETFIVRHDDGMYRQVGRQCLKDFLGHDPANLIAYRDWLDDIVPSGEEVEGWGVSAPRLYPVKDVIEAAARVVTKVGFYVSRAKAEQSAAEGDNEVDLWREAGSPDDWTWKHRTLFSTSAETKEVLDPLPRERKRIEAEYPHTTEVDTLVEDTTAALVEMRAKDAKSEWEWSVEAATNVDFVQMRNVGVIASAVILGMRRQEWRTREREAREAAKKLAAEHPMEYIGKVGDRVKSMPAEVTFVRYFDSQWGGSYLVRMLAERGTLVWWASSGVHTVYNPATRQTEPDLHVGDKVTITGTVKKHEPDRLTSLPTTVLTRCKMDVTECGHEKQETPQ